MDRNQEEKVVNAMQGTMSRITVNAAVVSADLDGEAVLLNVETGVYFGLDQLGTEIWKGIERGDREDIICEQLLEQYDVEPRQVRQDLADFVAQLVEKGLVDVRQQ
jgi:hypothetical protein